MNVLLVSANTETINMPTLPVGLGLVAAAVERAGHRVRFLDLMTAADPDAAIAETVAAFRPDAIGISIRNVDDQVSLGPGFLLAKARSVVAACKRLSPAPVVLGGAGYSMFPDSALTYLGADMGIRGEGEGAFVMLLDRLAAGGDPGDVPGLHLPGAGCRTPRDYRVRLDDWTFPDPELFDASYARNPSCYLPFQTRRGCPLGCSYCSTAAIEGSRIRMRSPAAAVAELARFRAAGFRRIYFVDNTFNLPAGYARELCARISAARLDISWRAIFYPGRTDEALIRAMAKAGCVEVSVGFESGNDRVLAGMGKHFTAADVRETARILRREGIARMGFLLLGGPDETRESALESFEFVDGLDLEAMKLTVGIRIYPETRLAERARQDGVIAADDDLLEPRFYIRPGLEDWLRREVSAWAAERPTWKI